MLDLDIEPPPNPPWNTLEAGGAVASVDDRAVES